MTHFHAIIISEGIVSFKLFETVLETCLIASTVIYIMLSEILDSRKPLLNKGAYACYHLPEFARDRVLQGRCDLNPLESSLCEILSAECLHISDYLGNFV